MSTPKEFVRRIGLIEWLEGKGFTARQVDALIAEKVIPQRHFEHPRRKSSRSKASKQHPKPAAKKKAGPELINGRAWYHTPSVAAALQIAL